MKQRMAIAATLLNNPQIIPELLVVIYLFIPIAIAVYLFHRRDMIGVG